MPRVMHWCVVGQRCILQVRLCCTCVSSSQVAIEDDLPCVIYCPSGVYPVISIGLLTFSLQLIMLLVLCGPDFVLL